MSTVDVQPKEGVRTQPGGWWISLGQRPYLPVLLLLIITLALYYPVKDHPFVNYDDNVYVTDNLQVQSGLSWDTVTYAFTTYDAGNWHPLTWLSHALDFQLFDLNPDGHHESSLVLHVLNAVLLFWVLLRATGFAGRSFMVAALFAVHPINVESVVWISERKTLLSMFFCLLALGAYRWYVSKPGVGRYSTVAILFALGLMAKPQIITFPFLLLLWDYWPLRRMSLLRDKRLDAAQPAGPFPAKSLVALVKEKLPLFAIAAASALMTMKAQRAAGAVGSLGAYPLGVRLSNAIVSYIRYIAKAFWPLHLAPMYPHPGDSLRAWQVYGAMLILLAITLLVADSGRRYLLMGWLWFVGALVPMIGIVQVGRQALADRYAYLPFLGLFIMICWGVAEWWKEERFPAVALPVLSVCVLLALTVAARRQIGYWADNVTLWTHTIAITGPNYIAQDDLGAALLDRGRMEEAIPHFRQAAAIHPVDPVSALNIGFYDQQHGNPRQAIEQYKRAAVLTTSPRVKAKALTNMGMAYRDLGDAEQARQCFEQAKKWEGQ